MNNNTVYEWILSTTFTVSSRQKSLQNIVSYISPLVHPGHKILDLCCGSGPASFWFEEWGAQVTGIDYAPYMIALAKQEASRRSSTVEFVEADIFKYEPGCERYDLISCFGNSISDFPHSDFTKLVKLVFSALRPSGRFALEYQDGIYRFIQARVEREGVYQKAPERITFRFKEYLPELGACLTTIRNEARGEEYDRRGYIYSVPVVRLIIGSALTLEQHVILDKDHFMDIFIKR